MNSTSDMGSIGSTTYSGGGLALQKQSNQAIATVDDNRALGLPTPGEMTTLKDFCREMVGTPFLPRTLVQGKSPEQQAGTLLAVILTGKEMGLLPMFSLRAFWLSPDGRLGMYADAMLGIMRSHGVKFKWLQNTNSGVKVEAERDGEQYLAEFTIEDANQAGLLNKAVWKGYPKAMCRARCIGEVFRALCADMGGTQMYSREELLDMEPEVDEKGDTRYVMADKAAEEDDSLSIKPKVVQAEVVQESTSIPDTVATPTPAPPVKQPGPDDGAKEAYKVMLTAIRTLVPGLKRNHPTDWLAGWFGDIAGKKPTAQECATAIQVLHDVLKHYPTAGDELLADPGALGIKMRVKMSESQAAPADIDNEAAEPEESDDPLAGVPNSAIAETFGWDADTCTSADRIIRDKAKVAGDDKAVVNALLGFGFKGMSNDDAVAMLTLYAYDTDAFLLRRKGEAKGISPTKLLCMVEDVLKKKIYDFRPGATEPLAAMNQVMAGL